METLDSAVVDRALAEGLDWRRDGNELVKTWTAKDFARVRSPTSTRWVTLAEKANHHPDVDIRWNRVTLRLSTHSAGALTHKDLGLAGSIDALGQR